MNNPGYDYTWNSDRRWAKNRQPTENFLCPGISLNNNFDYKWDEQENTNPCSGKRIQNFDHANSGAREQNNFSLKLIKKCTWERSQIQQLKFKVFWKSRN